MGLLNGDIVQVSFRGLCFAQQIIMVRTYQLVGPGVAGQTVRQDLQNIITSVDAAGLNDIRTPYLACLPPQYTLAEIRAQRINPNRSAYTSSVPAGAVGTNANAATVACDSACITLRGPDAGPHNLSNMKIGPAPDGASAAGLITGAYNALLTALASTLLTPFTPVGWAATTVNPLITNKTFTSLVYPTTFNIGLESRVMRRRVVGRGK